MKVNVTINDELLAKIDKKSDEMFMSRSGFISLACSEKLQSLEAVELLAEMTAAFKAIAVQGAVDEDTVAKLEVLLSVFKGIYGG